MCQYFQYESQSSFGSMYKTRIDGNNMFCDFFNPSQATYCKRLRVLCPEHFKDSTVISDFEVNIYTFNKAGPWVLKTGEEGD